MLGLKLMGPRGGGETAQAAYTGARYYRTDSGIYLKDFGKGDSDDSAKLYSGQMLDFDGVDDKVVIGDIGATCNTLTMTINPATTSEALIQLAPSKSLAIVSGTIVPVGLTNITVYVDAAVGGLVTANYHRIVVTFDDVLCADIQIGYNGDTYFDGFLGNVQIWNAVFDADDVEYDYLNCYQNLTADNRPGTSLTSANLKGHWPLIEGSGDVAYDWSGNGNHGTINLVTAGNTSLPTAWANAAQLTDPSVIQTALTEWGMGSNILPYSDMFDSPWAFQHVSRSENGTRLDGRTAILLTEDGVTGQHRLRLLYTDFVAGTNTLRIRVKKAGTKDHCDSALYNSTDGTVAKARLTFSTGLLSSITGDASVENLGDNWFQVSVSGVSTVDGTFISGIGENLSVAGINGPSIWIDGVQGFNGDIGAATITHAQGCTNAITPIRSWETAGQFKRDYSELNWNGRSYADCGNGADVNPSTAVIVECVVNMEIPTSTQFIVSRKGFSLYVQNNGNFALNVETPSDSHYTILSNGIDGATHHFVCVFSASLQLIRVYKNNVKEKDETMLSTDNITANANNMAFCSVSTTSPNLFIMGQLPHFKMWIDAEAQAIIDGDLDAWVTKQYNKAKTKYGL